MTAEEIADAIADARKREREAIAAINALGGADEAPARDGPTADRIRALDAERRAAVEERRRLTAERAELVGDAQAVALSRRRRGRGRTVKAELREAIRNTAKVGGGQ